MTEQDKDKIQEPMDGGAEGDNSAKGSEPEVDKVNNPDAKTEEKGSRFMKRKHKDDKDELLTAARLELAEMKDKFVRLYAEYDNYRRRTAKEKLEMLQMASADVLLDILPIADDFERAIIAMEKLGGSEALDGIRLIHGKFLRTLESKGLKVMDSAGQDFNTDLHDALTQIPAPSEELKGKVVDVIEKGYMLHDKVLRHAKVVVGV